MDSFEKFWAKNTGNKPNEKCVKNIEIYSEQKIRNNGELILFSSYLDYNYYIVSFGSHPCAYIDVSDTILSGMDYMTIEDTWNISCHGGLTYSDNYVVGTNKKGWFIGWDYAHHGDYFCGGGLLPYGVGKRWTVQEISDECKDVIKQLVNLKVKNYLKMNEENMVFTPQSFSVVDKVEPRVKCKNKWFQNILCKIFGYKVYWKTMDNVQTAYFNDLPKEDKDEEN